MIPCVALDTLPQAGNTIQRLGQCMVQAGCNSKSLIMLAEHTACTIELRLYIAAAACVLARAHSCLAHQHMVQLLSMHKACVQRWIWSCYDCLHA